MLFCPRKRNRKAQGEHRERERKRKIARDGKMSLCMYSYK